MSDLIQIEKELVRLATNLDDLTQDFEGLCRVAADARTDYDVEWSKSLLRAEGTQKVREAEATLACQKYMREARIAESIRDSAKERIRAIESLLTVHQSRLKWIDEGARVGTEGVRHGHRTPGF
jgi:hypothetical protein